MTSLVEDYWEIVCHDVLVSHCSPDCDLVKSDPIFKVFLAVIFLSFSSLKLRGHTTWRRCEENCLRPGGHVLHRTQCVAGFRVPLFP